MGTRFEPTDGPARPDPFALPPDPGSAVAFHTARGVTRGVNRRELLKWFSAGAGAAAVGGGAWLAGRGGEGASGGSSPMGTAPGGADGGGDGPMATAPRSMQMPAAPADRLLVMIELAGGNDGLSMAAPLGDGRYRDLRPSLAEPEGDPFVLDAATALHPRLARVATRGPAVLQGVGSLQPDYSHFEMQVRWWEGSPDASRVYDTGVLGRLADAVGDPDAPVVALSVSDGAHPIMFSRTASTLTVPDVGATWYLTGANSDDVLRQRFQRAYRAFGADAAEPYTARRREVMERTVRLAEAVGEWDDDDHGGYRDDRLGNGLRMALRLFDRGVGLRIVHITMDGGFDTHDGHGWKYPELMSALDDNLGAFFDDLDAAGMADKVLVATMSEFGRTVGENGSGGLDHGAAASMLLLGPVMAGVHGEAPSFAGLSAEDGLPATLSFDHYFGTIAERWFGVPSSEVIDGGTEVIDGLFAG